MKKRADKAYSLSVRLLWRSEQESNPRMQLRKLPSYPLDHRSKTVIAIILILGLGVKAFALICV